MTEPVRFDSRTLLTAAAVFYVFFFYGAAGMSSAQGLRARDLDTLRLAHIDPPLEAPDFNLPTLDEKRLALSSLRGKGVLVYFWATW